MGKINQVGVHIGPNMDQKTIQDAIQAFMGSIQVNHYMGGTHTHTWIEEEDQEKDLEEE